MLVSAIYQNESAIGICMSPSSCVSLPPPTAHLPSQPTLLDCHRAPDLSSLHHTANFHWLSILQMVINVFSREQRSLTQSTNVTLVGIETCFMPHDREGLHWASRLLSPSPHCSTPRRATAGGQGPDVLCGPWTSPQRPLPLCMALNTALATKPVFSFSLSIRKPVSQLPQKYEFIN